MYVDLANLSDELDEALAIDNNPLSGEAIELHSTVEIDGSEFGSVGFIKIGNLQVRDGIIAFHAPEDNPCVTSADQSVRDAVQSAIISQIDAWLREAVSKTQSNGYDQGKADEVSNRIETSLKDWLDSSLKEAIRSLVLGAFASSEWNLQDAWQQAVKSILVPFLLDVAKNDQVFGRLLNESYSRDFPSAFAKKNFLQNSQKNSLMRTR